MPPRIMQINIEFRASAEIPPTVNNILHNICSYSTVLTGDIITIDDSRIHRRI
jgi:hypothetical protein